MSDNYLSLDEESYQQFYESLDDFMLYHEVDLSKVLPVSLIAKHLHDHIGHYNNEADVSGVFVYKYNDEDRYLVYTFDLEGDENDAFHMIQTAYEIGDEYDEEKNEVVDEFINNHITIVDHIDPNLYFANKLDIKPTKYASDSLSFVTDMYMTFSDEKELIKFIRSERKRRLAPSPVIKKRIAIPAKKK